MASRRQNLLLPFSFSFHSLSIFNCYSVAWLSAVTVAFGVSLPCTHIFILDLGLCLWFKPNPSAIRSRLPWAKSFCSLPLWLGKWHARRRRAIFFFLFIPSQIRRTSTAFSCWHRDFRQQAFNKNDDKFIKRCNIKRTYEQFQLTRLLLNAFRLHNTCRFLCVNEHCTNIRTFHFTGYDETQKFGHRLSKQCEWFSKAKSCMRQRGVYNTLICITVSSLTTDHFKATKSQFGSTDNYWPGKFQTGKQNSLYCLTLFLVSKHHFMNEFSMIKIFYSLFKDILFAIQIFYWRILSRIHSQKLNHSFRDFHAEWDGFCCFSG